MPKKPRKIERRDTGLRWIHGLTFLIVCAPLALATAEETSHQVQAEMNTTTLFDFDSPEEAWRNVDDSVMGGVSSSRMRIEDGTAIFQGELSLENNGGFASVRSDLLEHDLAGFEGVRLRVKGDGQRYQLRIRADRAFDGPSHQMTFETKKDAWIEVDLPFSDFFAAYRGRQMPNHPPIDAAKIATMGILIADKQEGNFRLEIDWVKAYRTEVSK
jgi:hypothetical protein